MYVVAIVLLLGRTASVRGDLVAHWKFDEGIGTVAADSSANNYDGMFTGDVQWSNEGVYGACLKFSGGIGMRSYVEMLDTGPIEFGDTDISISAWIKTGATEKMTILTNVRESGHYALEETRTLGVNRDGVHIGKVSYNNALVTSVDSSVTVNDGEWHQVTLVQNHSVAGSEKWSLYVDGYTDAVKSLDNNPDAGALCIRIGGGISHPSFSNSFIGLIDDVRIYDHALSATDVRNFVIGEGVAFDPIPVNMEEDVARDVTLSWTPGTYADKHNVYFGLQFSDVNEADESNPLDVLVSPNQETASYRPVELIELDRNYYWRIDEVSAPPESSVYRGNVWQFTAEPTAFAIPEVSLSVTASSTNTAAEGPENTINNSGLDDNDLHSVSTKDMWLSSRTGEQPTWIEYAFDRVYDLHELQVWNHNSTFESWAGYGIKEAMIAYSSDGTNWTPLDATVEFARSPGTPGLAANTTVNMSGIQAKYVKITAHRHWGTFVTQYGLSEVRFLTVPTAARKPVPASGATGVDPELTLSWRAGRKAALHEVYVDTDEQVVINGTAPMFEVTEASFDVTANLGQTLYWKVVEVNGVDAWEGPVWDATVSPYLVVDDMESYSIAEGEEIYVAWVDGFADGHATNGALVGSGFYGEPEMVIVHSGSQTMPIEYGLNNQTISEATHTFEDAPDWSKHGIRSLSLYFRGTALNTVGRLYIKINETKYPYPGNSTDIQSEEWLPFNVDLSGVTVVNTLVIGVEYGSGVVYVDDIHVNGPPME